MKAILLLCLVVVAIQAVEENIFQFYFENMLPDLNACGSNLEYERVLEEAIAFMLNSEDTRLLEELDPEFQLSWNGIPVDFDELVAALREQNMNTISVKDFFVNGKQTAVSFTSYRTPSGSSEEVEVTSAAFSQYTDDGKLLSLKFVEPGF